MSHLVVIQPEIKLPDLLFRKSPGLFEILNYFHQNFLLIWMVCIFLGTRALVCVHLTTCLYYYQLELPSKL